MESYERIDARGVRETGRPVSFVPKGALTHHPKGAVVFPAEIVRSPRGLRCLRTPLDKAAFLSNCQLCPCS